MNASSISFGRFSVVAAEGWKEITDELPDGFPLTLADPHNGVGAMQFSVATVKGGAQPQVSMQDLESLLEDYTRVQGFECSHGRRLYDAAVFGIGRSFRSGTDFVRVWYLSDGSTVILVTYVCDWSKRTSEEHVRECIVRSLMLNK